MSVAFFEKGFGNVNWNCLILDWEVNESKEVRGIDTVSWIYFVI